MRARKLLAASLVLSAGCYHAVVDTGRPPSPQVIDKEWAHGFLWGLVPPSTVETAGKCSSGVSKVETQMSFLNLIANIITSGIYSPMQITVTCAASGTSLLPQVTRTPGEDLQTAIERAGELALASGGPVLLHR